jgi:hypothetical protein
MEPVHAHRGLDVVGPAQILERTRLAKLTRRSALDPSMDPVGAHGERVTHEATTGNHGPDIFIDPVEDIFLAKSGSRLISENEFEQAHYDSLSGSFLAHRVHIHWLFFQMMCRRQCGL